MPNGEQTREDHLRQLLNPDDDRAWKLAVGFHLGDMVARQHRLEERLRTTERMYMMALGGLGLLTMILLPIVGAFARELVG